MRSRYFRDDKGKPSIRAVVYESADHNIPRSAIDADAGKICSRLAAQGHEAYIVGGAVRDLLLGRMPKDFDIATDASPARVKRLFRELPGNRQEVSPGSCVFSRTERFWKWPPSGHRNPATEIMCSAPLRKM